MDTTSDSQPSGCIPPVTSRQKTTGLLGLPLEIRHCIYEYLCERPGGAARVVKDHLEHLDPNIYIAPPPPTPPHQATTASGNTTTGDLNAPETGEEENQTATDGSENEDDTIGNERDDVVMDTTGTSNHDSIADLNPVPPNGTIPTLQVDAPDNSISVPNVASIHIGDEEPEIESTEESANPDETHLQDTGLEIVEQGEYQVYQDGENNQAHMDLDEDSQSSDDSYEEEDVDDESSQDEGEEDEEEEEEEEEEEDDLDGMKSILDRSPEDMGRRSTYRYSLPILQLSDAPPPTSLLCVCSQIYNEVREWYYAKASLNIDVTAAFNHGQFFEQMLDLLTKSPQGLIGQLRKFNIRYVWDSSAIPGYSAGEWFTMWLSIRTSALTNLLRNMPFLSSVKLHWHDTFKDDEVKNRFLNDIAEVAGLQSCTYDVREYYGPELEEGQELSPKTLLGQRREYFRDNQDGRNFR